MLGAYIVFEGRALADGNKPTAWAATRLFFGSNDYRITATEDERFELTIAVATRELDTVTMIAARLAQITVARVGSSDGDA